VRGCAAGGFPLLQDENDDAVLEGGRGSSKSSDWVSTLMGLPLRLDDELDRLQPDRHDAADEQGEALMALELISALVLSVIVIAHGVGSLK